MFCSLFKRVNVTKSEKLFIIACNKVTNYLGIGGSKGFVQVVQIDVTKSKGSDGSNANQLTFTQNLQCHTKSIILLRWNDHYDKLTTCDEGGVIVVWKFERGKWDTEMINNREVSSVTDLKWSKQGQYLCFVYDDGHAIVGTVEGSRCWGNDIKDKLYLIEWSPDGTFILFACLESNIIVFSTSGYQMGEMEIDPSLKNVKIASLCWWTNQMSENQNSTLDKHLMVAFANGVVLLYDNYTDTTPLKFVTNYSNIYCAEWNPAGDIIAIAGTYNDTNSPDKKDGVNFYSPDGCLLKSIRSPDVISHFCWDANGTKLAIASENTVYFALVKPKYKWTYFSDTLVYSFMTESEHHTMIFWDTKKNVRNLKYVKNMIDITSHKSFCIISAKIVDNSYLLVLSNSIGSPVDNRIISINPILITMNDTHIVVSNKHYVYLWQFRGSDPSLQSKDMTTLKYMGENINIELLKKKMMKEICFFIEDNPNLSEVYNSEAFSSTRVSGDPISAIYANDNFLLIACDSGRALRFAFPHLTAPDRIALGVRLNKVGLSGNGQYLWGIDDNNLLGIWDIEKTSTAGKKLRGLKLEYEKKDVWNVIWSEEDKLKFAYLDKNRLNIIKDLDTEEVLTCNGYLAEYSQLEITAVMLEELMFKPWDHNTPASEIVIKFETRILRDLRELINNKIAISEIYLFVEQHSHRKLWEIFAQHALLNLDFFNAEKAMIHYNDYLGLNFIRRVKTIDDDLLKKAEILQFFLDYDKAEEVYYQADRKDLIISMRIKLGHWERVIQLIKDSGYVQEDNLKVAYNNYADQLLEKKEYDKAEELFKITNNIEALVNLWILTEDFDKATKLIEKIPEGSEFLLFMGDKFETYGLCDEAVQCYLRFGDVKRAIDTCVLMNKWNIAVELAEKNNFFQIEGLVNKFCNILIEKNKKMDLVELYRKAHRHTDAAKILIKVAEDLKALNASPIILKKIYVVAALEMESFKSRLIDAQITNITQQSAVKSTTLDTLITSDLSNVSDKALNNPWKGAEAYHFYMLCQAQLYQKKNHSALKTALRLVQYEKELEPKEVYRLIALSAFLNKSFKECSKALAKLENMPNIPKREREQYQELAISIFTQNEPFNLKEKEIKCPGKNCDANVSEFDIDCKNCGSNFSPCVVSGQSIFMKDYFKCKRCKHKSLKSEVMEKVIKVCALCHISLDLTNK